MNNLTILIIIVMILMCGCLDMDNTNQNPVINKPTLVPTPVPTSVFTSIENENLLIDNISKDLKTFNRKGWSHLYEINEFDCSRMSVYMWDHIQKKYKIPVKIIISPTLQHAWLAIRVSDVGKTDKYLTWTHKNISYYYIEATAPNVVILQENIKANGILYSNTKKMYSTRIFMYDCPLDAKEYGGKWGLDFRLTKSDLNKLEEFNN